MSEDDIDRLLGELRSAGAEVFETADALLKTAEDRGHETVVSSKALGKVDDALAVYRLKAAEGAAVIERAEAATEEMRCG